MTTQVPVVSVVMPAFNAERFIDEALDSVFRQRISDVEVLVADDGSTDGTRTRVEAWQSKLTALRWLDAPVRAGRPSVPRNRALSVARGTFVAFLDADDVWTPGKMDDQLSVMRKYPDLVLVYSILRAFGAGISFARAGYGLKPWPLTAATDARSLESANTIPCSTVMARRDVLQRLGGFDEDPELNAVEDYDLWLRVSRVGPIGFIPRIHGGYRVHASGISRDIDAQRRRAEYLVSKRHLDNFTFREFKRRTPAQTLGRNAADVAMTAALKGRAWIERVTARPAPVWRAAGGAV